MLGGGDLFSNYRPTSLVSVAVKLIWKTFQMSILNHLEVEYPLAMERDGSTEDVSRLTNLIGREFVLQKDINTPADVNFTDLIKAFYKDSHLNRK